MVMVKKDIFITVFLFLATKYNKKYIEMQLFLRVISIMYNLQGIFSFRNEIYTKKQKGGWSKDYTWKTIMISPTRQARKDHQVFYQKNENIKTSRIKIKIKYHQKLNKPRSEGLCRSKIRWVYCDQSIESLVPLLHPQLERTYLFS